MKTDKLELAHLAAYLPYGLKVILTEHKDSFEGEDYYDEAKFSKGAIWTLSGYADKELNIPMGEGEINGFIFSSDSTYCSIEKGFKPLLLPFESLDASTIRSIAREMLSEVPDYFDTLENCQSWINGMFNDGCYDLPYRLFVKLLEKHVDVFNLIPADLALPITIQNNS